MTTASPPVRPSDRLSDESAVRIAVLQRELSGRFQQPKSRWWREWSWLLLTLLALLAFGLAVAGSDPPFRHRLADAIHLFPSGFPARPGPGESKLLTVGKYLAAFVSVFLTLGVISAVYARSFIVFRARLRRGHVVVCGLGEKGLRSARAFRHKGAKVTCVDLDGRSDAANDMRARGAIVLEGDATQASILAAARVDRATHVVCACHEDSVNASIAAQVARRTARRGSKRANVFVHISNPELSALLRAPALGLESVRMQFFNIYELWAQALVDEGRLDEIRAEDAPPQIIVIGSTGLARSIVIHVARRWHDVSEESARRIRITLIAPEARTSCASLTARYPALSRIANLVPADHAESSSEPLDLAPVFDPSVGESTIVYVCLDDDAQNLSLALQAQDQLPGGARVMVPATAWTGELAPLLIDPSGGIHAVGYSPHPDSFDLLRDSTREAMAREVHGNYRTGLEVSREADVAWADLPEDLRESNRLQVDSMVRHLRALWYELAPLYDWDASEVELSDAEVNTLAELEHLRWCAEKRAEGYRYGEVQSDSHKDHSDLVEWSRLSDVTRQKDRQAVHAWPGILARVGCTLKRSPLREKLAELIHERHRKSQLAAVEADATSASLVPWEQLSDEQRELNRASADDISVKLARIGCRVAWAWDDSNAFSFTPDEVELLAELEHDRWSETLVAQGWQAGTPRDEIARVHPDLIPWDDLPEERRGIDRDHVQAIPHLLSLVGLRIAREQDGEAQL